MFKRISVPENSTDAYQMWVELCIDVATDTVGIDGVIIKEEHAKFLFDGSADLTPTIVERNLQLKFNSHKLCEKTVPLENRDFTISVRSDVQLEYHSETEEFVTDSVL
jgi:hypothetical protein